MGYFGITKNKVRITSIWTDTWIYSFLGLMLYLCLERLGLIEFADNLSKISYVTPVSSQVYWFVSVYIIISLMKPIFNKVICRIKKKALPCIMFLLLIYYLLTRISAATYMGIIRGMILYFIGAEIYLSKEDIIRNKRSWLYLMFGIVFWLTYILTCNIDYFNIGSKLSIIVSTLGMCIIGTSSAVFIMLFTLSRNNFINNNINMIASTTFGIYLIHEHPLLREFIWSKVFHVEMQYTSSYFIFMAIGTVSAIFVFGMILDFIKKKLIDRKLIVFKDKLEKFAFERD